MNSKLAASILYSMDDATLVAHAENILGTNKLRLSLEEAVVIVRNHYNNRPDSGTTGCCAR